MWIVYNSYERGSYIGEFELPDGEEFDPSKLIVHLTEVAESWTIVSNIEYNGEDILFNISDIHFEVDFSLLGVNQYNVLIFFIRFHKT